MAAGESVVSRMILRRSHGSGSDAPMRSASDFSRSQGAPIPNRVAMNSRESSARWNPAGRRHAWAEGRFLM